MSNAALKNTKQILLDVMKGLPKDATLDDALERLYYLTKIERGLEDIKSGRVVSHKEAKRRLQKWLK